MPVKKDETGKQWVEIHFTVPGTPEQVWQALATGPGNTAWFTRATIEERVGGTLKFHFGPDVSTTGEVTRWEPPRFFSYVEREWGENAPPLATEITISSRSGDQCVVRMVHSLFSSNDDWDDQMEGFEQGWVGFIEVLRLYLAHYSGNKAASFQVMHSVQTDQLATWSKLMERLNLVRAHVGERWETSHPEKLSGVVERIHQDRKMRTITLRLDAPAAGVAIIGAYDSDKGINTSVSTFYYGDNAEAQVAASQPKWLRWIQET